MKTIAVVADKGYFKIEDIEACEQAGIEPYVPRPQRGPSVKAGLFRKDEFQYDADSDSYVCPAGQRLYPYSSSLLRGLKKINYANRLRVRNCQSVHNAPMAVSHGLSPGERSGAGPDAGAARTGGRTSSTGVARRSNTHLARSSSG